MSSEKKRILLVNPPSGFLMDQRVFLPLGIAHIASVAERQGHKVSLLDMSVDGDYILPVVNELRSQRYDAVGITATSPQFFYAYKINQAIKDAHLPVKTIVGGPHASMFSALRRRLIQSGQTKGLDDDINFTRLEEFDVIAEGEEASLEAALNSDNQWVNGRVTEELDSLPLPARHLFDVGSYLFDSNGSPKFKIDGRPTGSVISQRGCPYTCEFCCGRDSEMYHKVRLSGGKLRALSPERIVEELNEMHDKFGLTSFMFYDDEFNLHPPRTIALCDKLEKTGYKFRGFVKGDLFVKNPEVAEAMKRAGFLEVLCGIESGSERILRDHLHKRTSPSLNLRAVEVAIDNGLDFKALTMAGNTGETEDDILQTKNWLLEAGKMYNQRVGPGHFTFDLTVFQPYPGCPIWDRAVPNTRRFAEEFRWVYSTKGMENSPNSAIYFNKVDFTTESGFYKGIPGQYKAFIRTDDITSERFVHLRDELDHEVREKLKLTQLLDQVKDQHEHTMGQN